MSQKTFPTEAAGLAEATRPEVIELQDGEEFDLDEWLPRVEAALETLDMIVLVSLETERIAFTPSDDDDDEELRATVDEELRDIVLDDCLGLDLRMEIVEVEGSVAERVNSVLRRIQKRQ